MKTRQSMTRLFALIIACGLSVMSMGLLSACTGMRHWGQQASLPARFVSPYPSSVISHDIHSVEGEAADALSMARTSTGIEQQRYQLVAANRLLEQGQLVPASELLALVAPRDLTPDLSAQWHILMARLAVLQHRTRLALRYAQKIKHPRQLSAVMQIQYHQVFAAAYRQSHGYIKAIVHYIALDDLLMQPMAIEANQQLLWDALQALPAHRLRLLASKSVAQPLKGWLALGAIAQQTDHAYRDFPRLLSQWRRQYPQHPANRFLTHLNAHLTTPPKHIAILLPLSGSLSGVGEAIRNGFFAAYHQDKAQDRGVNIELFDTSAGEINTVYQKAVNAGADFIVGPLSKEAIAALSNQVHLSVPTLALNQVAMQAAEQPQLWQFGLSPKDEALQVAQRAWQYHYRRAVIIAPGNRWGQSIASTWMTAWEHRQGELVANLAFSNQRQINQEIHQLLGVADSEHRSAVLQRILKEKIRSVPRRRQDIDVIFLAALPYQGRQIRPLLKFYYGGHIPVYAISSIYSGQPQPQKDNDLNGITFCDTPWAIQSPNKLAPWLKTLHQELATLWPDSFKQYHRFYGFGIDAYRVMTGLAHLKALPHFGLDGATGRLYLTKDQQIYRHLQWARMRHGQPRSVSS